MDTALLKPGDVLLFRRKGFVNWIIYHATNSPVSHTETYMSGGFTAASRNGKGVNFYPLDTRGLAVVLRPKRKFNYVDAVRYQWDVAGAKYDWKGLWRAFVKNSWKQNDASQWCSENTTLVQRAGGIEPFTVDTPPHAVAPGDFLKSAAYDHIWKADDFPL